MPAVIFDLDGVLVDSEPYWRDGFRAAVALLHAAIRPGTATGSAAEFALPTDAELLRFEGGRVPDTVRSLAEHFFSGSTVSDELLARAAAHAVDTATRLLGDDPRPIAGNVSVAHALVAAGTRVAVASSSPASFIDAALDALGLAAHVSVRESAYALRLAKPHPEVYLNALERLGVSPRSAVAIEDSATGTTAALRAGIPTIWVNAGFTDEPAQLSTLRAEGGIVTFIRTLSLDDINLIAEESSL